MGTDADIILCSRRHDGTGTVHAAVRLLGHRFWRVVGVDENAEAVVYVPPLQSSGTSATLNLLALSAEDQIVSLGYWIKQTLQAGRFVGSALINIMSGYGGGQGHHHTGLIRERDVNSPLLVGSPATDSGLSLDALRVVCTAGVRVSILAVGGRDGR